MISYHIISSGSEGNAVVINDYLMIDCGVPYKAIKPFVDKLKLVLLTHIHSDHFQKRTIKRLSEERPTLRFGCGRWLVQALVESGVPRKNIDVMDYYIMYGYGLCNIIPVPLTHNVPNCGYKIHTKEGKLFYATDTNSLDGIQAKKYDLYMIEANYVEEEIQERIAEKKANGQYAYEKQVLKNHLSKAKCDDFYYRNRGYGSELVYLHCHKNPEEK